MVWYGLLLYQKKTFCPVSGPTVSLLRGPPPEVAQQAGTTLSFVCEASSTEPTLEIQWYYITTEGQKLSLKTSSSAVQRLPFTIKSIVFLRANILTTVTSTLTVEHLSAAYAGDYACTAVAGDIKVESDAFQFLVSGAGASGLKRDTTMVCYCTALTCINGLHVLPLHSPCRYHCEEHLASHLMCDRLSRGGDAYRN